MTAAQRFYLLLSILVILMGAIVALIKIVWGASRAYNGGLARLDKASEGIVDLGEDLKALVKNKEKDHDKIDKRFDRLEARLERHEVWHAEATLTKPKSRSRPSMKG